MIGEFFSQLRKTASQHLTKLKTLLRRYHCQGLQSILCECTYRRYLTSPFIFTFTKGECEYRTSCSSQEEEVQKNI